MTPIPWIFLQLSRAFQWRAGPRDGAFHPPIVIGGCTGRHVLLPPAQLLFKRSQHECPDRGSRAGLSAKVAVGARSHVLGQIGPTAMTEAVGDAQRLEIRCRRSRPGSGGFELRIDARNAEPRAPIRGGLANLMQGGSEDELVHRYPLPGGFARQLPPHFRRQILYSVVESNCDQKGLCFARQRVNVPPHAGGALPQAVLPRQRYT